MTNLFQWIKTHQLSSWLILIIAVYLAKSWLTGPLSLTSPSLSRLPETSLSYESADFAAGAPAAYKSSGLSILPPVYDTAAPQTGVSDRLVVRESNLSLVVKNVRQTVNQIIDRATQAGGYLINSNLTQPEEAPYASIEVRIPVEQLDTVLEYYRSLAIKVTSEYLQGHDVTDEYLDINTRITRLKRTQAKFEDLLDQAVKFEDILRAQQEVLNLQDQIDNLLGRRQYLEQTAKLAKLTIYLSTDEFALPYTPSETFRPAVIFKLAVRSLILTMQILAEKVIWAAVYSVVWLPALLLFLLARHWWTKRQSKSM